MLDRLQPYSEYKDIDQPWVGAVPAHWRAERGKRLFIRMQRPARDEDQTVTCFRDGVVTLRKNRRLRGFTEALKEIGYQGIRAGDLVIHAMDAFAGAVGVSDSDGKGSPVYQVCQPREGVNAKYYAFLVREMSRSQWIMALAKGIRERSTDFRFETFGGQFLPLPPPAEQAGIVRFLGAVDRKVNRFIRAKRRLIEVLTEQKQAIITHAVTKGLNPHAPLKPSGIDWLGDVPEHWEIWQIGHFAAVGNGSTPSRGNMAYWAGGTFPWLNSSTVNSRTISASDQFVTDTALRECHLPRVPAGTVLVAITGQGKTRGMAAVLTIEATINQHLAFIRPRSTGMTATPEYLRLFLHAAYPELRRMSDDSGSTKGAITCEDLRHFRVALMPRAEQEAVVSAVAEQTRDVDAVIDRTEREIDLIREYRTRLVADVVTGKVDVRAAAAALPDEPTPSTPAGEDFAPAEDDDPGAEADADDPAEHPPEEVEA